MSTRLSCDRALWLRRFTAAVCGLLACTSCSASTDMMATPNDGAQSAELQCGEQDTGLPADVFCTGLYQGRDPTKYRADVTPYTPGVVLWSDGAEKHRYLYLPPSAQIDTSNMDVWKFPAGTKAWKEFKLDGKLVETRLFWKRNETTWE